MRGCQGLAAAALLATGALANTEMAQVHPSLCAPETNELLRQVPWYVSVCPTYAGPSCQPVPSHADSSSG